MGIRDEVREELGDDWIPSIYLDKVRTQRTRAYSLDVPEKENQAEILYTLLGIELKVGKRRFSCPDLATARYIRVFARVGCRSFAIPYDITCTSPLADELETAWQRMILLAKSGARASTSRSAARSRSVLISEIRNELRSIGPGELMPAFRQTTKQRNA